MVGLSLLRSEVEAAGDGAGVVLQAYGVQGSDVGVGAFLQTVLERGCAAQAPDAGHVAAAAANAVDGTGEDAVPKSGGRRHAVAHEAGGIVAGDIEGGGDGALPDDVRAVGKAHEAAGVEAVGGDGAGDVQVLDGGVLDVAEGSCALSVSVGDVGCQGVGAAEEGAAEAPAGRSAGNRTDGRGDGDVGIQAHILAVVVHAAGHLGGKQGPVIRAADEIGAFGRAVAFECRRNGKREGLRARVVVTLACEDECVVALLGDADGERRHVGAVQRGREVGAEGESRIVEARHCGRDVGVFLLGVSGHDAADGAGQVVHLIICSLRLHAELTLGTGGIDHRTLCVAQRRGVVAVVAYVAAKHEGGADGDGGLAVSNGERRVGGIERAGDVHGLVVGQTDEAATLRGAVRGEQTAVVDAVLDGQSSGEHGRKTAVGALAGDAAVDGGAHATAREGRRAVAGGHQTGSKLPGGVDVASHLQVLDVGAVHIAERGAILLAKGCFSRAACEGQRVVVAAEEGSRERAGGAGAQHRRNADVGIQLQELPSVVLALGNVGSEEIPVGFTADEEGVLCCSLAIERFAHDEPDALRAGVDVRAFNGGEHERVVARCGDGEGEGSGAAIQRGREVGGDGRVSFAIARDGRGDAE